MFLGEQFGFSLVRFVPEEAEQIKFVGAFAAHQLRQQIILGHLKKNNQINKTIVIENHIDLGFGLIRETGLGHPRADRKLICRANETFGKCKNQTCTVRHSEILSAYFLRRPSPSKMALRWMLRVSVPHRRHKSTKAIAAQGLGLIAFQFAPIIRNPEVIAAENSRHLVF